MRLINRTLLWRVALFLSFAAGIGLLLLTLQSIDYIWRWNRVPQYFYYTGNEPEYSPINGEVGDVIEKGKKSQLVLYGDGEKITIVVDSSMREVGEGDFISAGDLLGYVRVEKIGLLTLGLFITLKLSVFSVFFGIIIGLFTGLFRISSNMILKWWARVYIEVIRGTPLLVQIFIVYFCFGTAINELLARYGPNFGLNFEINRFWFGVAALSLFAGAYVAEIFRAGIASIHKGQMEAARSLGMGYVQAMSHVILPQAFKRILPPLAGQFISLIKDSSLVSVVAITDLSKAAREVITVTFATFEVWLTVALLYFVLTFTLSMAVNYLERRYAISD